MSSNELNYRAWAQEEWEKFYNKNGNIETELFYKAGLLKKEVYYDEEGKIYKTNAN